MSMFEQAGRLKYRFKTPQGNFTAEDLWDISLTSKTGKANLNSIAMDLYNQTKDASDVVSFVDDALEVDETSKNKLDIVKHVIQVRKAENAAVLKAKSNSERKLFLKNLLAQRETDDMQKLSADEINKMISELDA